MKRIFSFIGLTLLTAMPLFANIAEGVSGDCTWVIDDDGNLIVSSEADKAVLGTWEGDAAPWSKYKESITTVSFTSPVDAQTCTYMFSGCTNLNAIYLDNFYTNKVTDMSYMFANCKSLEVIEFGMTINPLDEDVLFAKGMFSNRDNFLTSNVKNMAGMFASDVSLNNISVLSSWDTQSVEDMSSMFYYNTSLTDISALSNWNTSSVKYMSSMFSYNRSLTDISALSNWNISSVTSMGYMFYGVNNIDATVLNGWNVSNVTNKYNMFTCPADKRPNWY